VVVAGASTHLFDDFDGFVEERERTITKHIASLVAAESPEAAVQ